MPKVLQKYFIAIVPEGEIQEKAADLKLQLKEKFNLKYALRSPAHVTLKMPFLWNEAKEDRLRSELGLFFQGQLPFRLKFKGIGKFSDRVIYMKVSENKALRRLQTELTMMCKIQLNLAQELSDYAYHPHMTIAFKDLKKGRFEEYFEFIKSKSFSRQMKVDHIALLKREDGRWAVLQSFPLLEEGFLEKGDI
jgi:2'-5' RNA ligase